MWFFQKVWPVITLGVMTILIGQQTGYYQLTDFSWWISPFCSTIIWFNVIMHVFTVLIAFLMHGMKKRDEFQKIIPDNVPRNIGVAMNMALLFWLQFYWASAVMVLLYFPVWYIRYKHYGLEQQEYES